MSECRRDRITAAVLGLVTVLWLLAVEGKQGIGRDEAQYFRAGERYWGWFESGWQNLRQGHFGRTFSRAGIDPFWGDNPEHPPLMKTLYGLSWRMFHRCHCTGPTRGLHPIPVPGKHVTLPLFARESSAFRFPAILMAGFGVALAFLFARRFLPPLAAGVAAVLAIAQPHYFFHAQISCFDAPITTMALLVGFAYWRSLRSRRWAILCGVFYGLAFATKLNAWLMPFFLAAHYLWLLVADLRARRKPRPAWAFLSMATLGPLVFFALWPYLWPDPAGRVGWYFHRHLDHEHYNFEYLGRNWNLPPKDWDLRLLRTTFPFVSTAFTVPATTLVLAVAGGVALWRRRRKRDDDQDVLRPSADTEQAPGIFLATQIFGPMCVLAIPTAPIFGGVKHFLPAVPYLAICAGIGLHWLIQVGSRMVVHPRWQRALPAAAAAIVCLPAVIETQRSHPDGLSHYNFFAGGFAGGASLGMNRQFWGYSVLPMLPWMVAHAPRSNAIYWHDVLPDALSMYMRDGRLPPGTGNVGDKEDNIPRSDLGIVIHEKHFTVFEGDFWTPYGTTQPAFVRTREGVPLVTAYRRPGAP
ncbi:MAG TPA: glycosyltransferase family 39 protein [Polyangia bacterium]|nr:glycosyltransferase family 39 protein [Polyangia bacterium]